MKPKIRIKLLDSNLGVISDRLVDQYTELLAGPKFEHNGPVSVEFTLANTADYDLLINYLNQLLSKVEIEKKRTYNKTGTTSSTKTQKEVPFSQVAQDIKKSKSQEKLIEYLSSISFHFVSYQFIQEYALLDTSINPKKYHPKLQYLVRRYKTHPTDPSKDQYDFRMAVGIKLMGKQIDTVYVFAKNKLKFKRNIPWEKRNDFNFKPKRAGRVFPEYMSHEERKKWRQYHEKVEAKRELKPKEANFYNRFKADVLKLNPGL